jgi:hypothetical protein
MNQFFEGRGFWFRFLTLIVIALGAVFIAVTFGTVFASLLFGADKIASHHVDTVLFLQAFVSVGLFRRHSFNTASLSFGVRFLKAWVRAFLAFI